MPTQIQIKRGLSLDFAPIKLKAGEPAFLADTGKLYVGNGTDKVLINPIDQPEGLDTKTSYSKVKVNDYGQVVELSNLEVVDIPPIPASGITGLGTAAVSNIGTASGNIPVLDAGGKLDSRILPTLAITDTFVVATQAAMLALTAEIGDVAVRTDTSQTFILKAAPASVLGNWVQLLQPTDTVVSVNTKVGAVVLAASDIALTGYTKAASYSGVVPIDTISTAVGKLEKHFDNFAPLLSPILIGTPKSTTPMVGDNTTNIATTAFVSTATAGFAPIASPNFTGAPKAPTLALGDNTTNIATTAYVMAALAVIDGGTF